MKILTAAQMREVDRITIEQHGIPGVALMENAGAGVVRAIEERYTPLAGHRFAVLCGKGNNGGDGFVVARQLIMRGLRPLVVVLGYPAEIQGEARSHYELLLKAGGQPQVAGDAAGWRRLRSELQQATVIVDAILGIGLSGPVRGLVAEVIHDLNADFARIPMLAVDMPSGVPSDSGTPAGESLHATTTVTFTAPKVGHVFPPNCERIGELVICPIGTPPTVFEQRADFFLNLIAPAELLPFTAARAPGAHKGDFGHVLVVAGGRGKAGAAMMAGAAALKIGAGLVTVATSESVQNVVAGYLPELMTEALPETDAGSISARALEYNRFQKLAEGKDVAAIGPGLGGHADTVAFVRRAVGELRVPAVLDADALNAFAGDVGLLKGHPGPLVLTPHPGEMSRLTGVSTAEVQRNRVAVARHLAMENALFVVLKGYRTLVATPDGQVFVNTTGNPGMAKGGSGDVLAGFIAGLLAQFRGRPTAEVLCAAVHLHGLAGDIAVRETGEKALGATDLVRFLPNAWARLAQGASG